MDPLKTPETRMPMPELGLVTAALEQELKKELRQRGIVVWLDRDEVYTPYVDDLVARHTSGDFEPPVVAFRGSFLEAVLALEAYGSSLDNQALLIHMPGYNEETIRVTPVLEMYEPGFRFRKALDTLVRDVASGRVAPDELEAFIRTPGLSLAAADTWLASKLSAQREGLAGLLEGMTPEAVVQDLVSVQPFLSAHIQNPEQVQVLLAWMHRQLGVDDAWIRFLVTSGHIPHFDELPLVVVGWILTVEYVHDLARPPFLEALRPLKGLAKPLVERCHGLAQMLRERFPTRYVSLADEVEGLLRDEFSQVRPEDLGRIDTFREEEARVLAAAIEALKVGEWKRAQTWAGERSKDRSFWLQQDPARKWAWSLVAEGAELGRLLLEQARPLAGARSLDEAIERYTGDAFQVDRAHRRFEQRRIQVLEPRLPHFGDFQEVVGDLRRRQRTWADQLARDFTRLCREQGFLPDEGFQQRTLFEQVVYPMTTGGERTAVFLVDAFRYEMATELRDSLTGPGVTPDLKARLAELPSLTVVGMNALAPVASHGRLTPAFTGGTFAGFGTGEFTVKTPDDRARAMGMRSQGKPALRLTLTEVCDKDIETLKRQVAQSRLVLVHSREIDDAGEAGLGLQTFENTLRQLQSAWHQLRAAGVKQFVFTADHGYLLLDETVGVRPYGLKRDPSRRHVLASEARAEEGMVNVSLSALNYDGGEGQYLLFREDTAVFATGTAGATFVHGGNSLQERVIPVLTLVQRREAAASLTAYVLEAQAGEGLPGLQCLKVRGTMAPAQSSLAFVVARTLAAAVRVPERPEVQVTLKGVRGGGALQGSKVDVPVGDTWCEVFFALQGPRDERVRVEVFHPDATECVTPVLAEAWFDVSGTGAGVGETAATAGTGWQDAFEDAGVRAVFEHLAEHGSITEVELNRMLGSPRAARQFALKFDGYLQKLPFKVRIEGTFEGKRYVKEIG